MGDMPLPRRVGRVRPGEVSVNADRLLAVPQRLCRRSLLLIEHIRNVLETGCQVTLKLLVIGALSDQALTDFKSFPVGRLGAGKSPWAASVMPILW